MNLAQLPDTLTLLSWVTNPSLKKKEKLKNCPHLKWIQTHDEDPDNITQRSLPFIYSFYKHNKCHQTLIVSFQCTSMFESDTGPDCMWIPPNI